ncbi:unnamed protein product [Mytilus edulis]|uniref:Uncharacterized protein n=1 Tax=Mytilus edulis TaxID=6550 RepID=A0A8S3PYV5_MYTED|nr:unnamed protein product [Mytilus edulis]
MAEHPKSIHVYSVHETTYTLDKAIQDILFDVFYLDEQNEDKLTDNILHFVDLWNRPDIAEKKIFKLENSKVLEELQDDRIDMVRQVLEYILDKTLYKSFLDNSLEGLYQTDGCLGKYLFPELKDKTLKQKKIVEMVNDAVVKILGSEEMKPFEKGSALFASSLAKRLAETTSAEAFMDEQTALWESSRHYEDLAYSVMTELYLNDRKHARQLLVTEVKDIIQLQFLN